MESWVGVSPKEQWIAEPTCANKADGSGHCGIGREFPQKASAIF